MNIIERPIVPSTQLGQNDDRPRWKARTKVLVAGGIVLALCGSVVTLDLMTSHTHRSTRRFAETVKVLDVDIASGSLRVIGTDSPATTVDIVVRGGLGGPSHYEVMEDHRLNLKSECGFTHLVAPTCELDYVVHAPPGVAVVAHSDGATVTIVGTVGDVDLSMNGGTASVAFAGAPPVAKAHINGGSVTIRVPNDANGYRVVTKSSGGSTKVDIRTDPSSDRLIDLHTNGGQIDVGYSPG